MVIKKHNLALTNKNNNQSTAHRADSFCESKRNILMNSILGVKTNRIPFIDDNSSATSGDNINQHTEYAVIVLNSRQPLWSTNIHFTQPPLSNNHSIKPRKNITKENQNQRSNNSNKKQSPCTQTLYRKTHHTRTMCGKENNTAMLRDSII